MLVSPSLYCAGPYRKSFCKALRYIMEASLYLPRSRYLLPLSRYRFLATFGSRLQEASGTIKQAAARRNAADFRVRMGNRLLTPLNCRTLPDLSTTHRFL